MAGGAARDVSLSISEFKYHVCLSYCGSDTGKGLGAFDTSIGQHSLRSPKNKHCQSFGKLEQGFGNDKMVKNWRYVLERVGKLRGWQYGERPESVLIPEIISTVRGWLANTCRSRKGKPLSDLLVEILVNLASPGISDFLAKHVVLDKIKYLLITFAVYCGVDRSDVRNVSRSFGKAFARFVDNSAHDEEKVLRWMFAMRAVGKLSGLHSGGRYLIEMSRSRRGKSLSDFHFGILAKLVSPAITDFPAKRLELDNIKQSLVTLAGKVTGKNMKTFTPESSVEKWSHRLENVTYLLDKAIEHIYLGREKDAKAQVNNMLKELETMMEHPDPFVHEQTIGKKKIIISFLQSYEERGSNNASVTVIVGSGKSRNTFLADNVYRDATVMDSFDIRGWVKFEDKLDALSLTKGILKSLNANFRDGDDLQTLMAQLHECLSGWKSMLVFDGFDRFQNWEILVKCIEAAERGSSIVLTASKADIIEIGDCIVFTDQNVVSVSEAVHVDLNSSDLPDNQFVWKTLHRTSSHYLKKQPNMILKKEVLEIAADELIEAQGLPAPSLKSIRLCNCKNLKSLPSGGLPSTLNLLSIAFCDKLTPQKEWELHRLHSLSRLEIESGCKGMESFPDK
ncbi:hypothetical protein L6164_023385 [Bauhinia variegata]|uniref:Uncharacterized protein n=1 Tax=Bauhinia variegata TaxID=167791 RepID=A0ACB9MIZ2_BAUVA|nr:hypothetical protein L6164_023385 [Bauhinia variegata]